MDSTATPVNYDSDPLLELEVEGLQYRLDSGKHGTALCVSTREPGSWDWQFVSEARWDGRDLRARAFDRRILVQLSAALAVALTPD